MNNHNYSTMKLKALPLLILIFLGVYSCQQEEINLEDQSTYIDLNLETFIPSQDLDNSPKGKYVGVLGHHTNLEIHGKIFINAGQQGQYDALAKLTNGRFLRFKGKPQTKDGILVYFEGTSGNFTMNFEDFANPILTSVQLYEENTEGYIVAQKSTYNAQAFVLTGTYVDESDPNFQGNWDLIGNGTVTDVEVQVTVPGIPVPVTISVPTENIGTLSISHSGSTTPFMDTTFEPNTAQSCIEDAIGDGFSSAPFMIPSDVPNPLGGDALGGAGSISSGGQTSAFAGFDATWSLSYGAPIPLANIEGGYSNDSCEEATGGTWSWNGRAGSISIDGI